MVFGFKNVDSTFTLKVYHSRVSFTWFGPVYAHRGKSFFSYYPAVVKEVSAHMIILCLCRTNEVCWYRNGTCGKNNSTLFPYISIFFSLPPSPFYHSKVLPRNVEKVRRAAISILKVIAKFRSSWNCYSGTPAWVNYSGTPAWVKYSGTAQVRYRCAQCYYEDSSE